MRTHGVLDGHSRTVVGPRIPRPPMIPVVANGMQAHEPALLLCDLTAQQARLWAAPMLSTKITGGTRKYGVALTSHRCHARSSRTSGGQSGGLRTLQAWNLPQARAPNCNAASLNLSFPPGFRENVRSGHSDRNRRARAGHLAASGAPALGQPDEAIRVEPRAQVNHPDDRAAVWIGDRVLAWLRWPPPPRRLCAHCQAEGEASQTFCRRCGSAYAKPRTWRDDMKAMCTEQHESWLYKATCTRGTHAVWHSRCAMVSRSSEYATLPRVTAQ